jgi:hypothetical protein
MNLFRWDKPSRGRDFFNVLMAGRRQSYFLWFKRRDGFLLTLSDLIEAAPARREVYKGIQTVRVDRIIGGEDQAAGFSYSFLPLKSVLKERWTHIRDLMLNGMRFEPVELLNYGGYYFVRDGHHRVSVAKSHGIRFLEAEVTDLGIPVSLPPHMTLRKLPIFLSKLQFHDETGVFHFIPEEKLGNGYPESWETLKEHIFGSYKSIVAESRGEVPEKKELVSDWYEQVFSTVMQVIHQEAIRTLFPYRYDVDIFCEFIRFWEELPTDTSLMIAIEEFVKSSKKKNAFSTALFLAKRAARRLFSTAAQEREYFFRISLLRIFRPEASIIYGRKDWYRFLTRQLMVTHYGSLGEKLGRNPRMEELIMSWYDTLYKPSYKLYLAHKIKEPFPVFYMAWMRSWNKHIIKIVRKRGYVKSITLEESLEQYLLERGKRKL